MRSGGSDPRGKSGNPHSHLILSIVCVYRVLRKMGAIGGVPRIWEHVALAREVLYCALPTGAGSAHGTSGMGNECWWLPCGVLERSIITVMPPNPSMLPCSEVKTAFGNIKVDLQKGRRSCFEYDWIGTRTAAHVRFSIWPMLRRGRVWSSATSSSWLSVQYTRLTLSCAVSR